MLLAQLERMTTQRPREPRVNSVQRLHNLYFLDGFVDLALSWSLHAAREHVLLNPRGSQGR